MKDASELENKGKTPDLTPGPFPVGKGREGGEKKIKVKIRPGRSVTGVTVDKDGYALVDEKTAERLYGIGYAIKE